jgi:hypothetical protein
MLHFLVNLKNHSFKEEVFFFSDPADDKAILMLSPTLSAMSG